jgi:hypothetical protein
LQHPIANPKSNSEAEFSLVPQEISDHCEVLLPYAGLEHINILKELK